MTTYYKAGQRVRLDEMADDPCPIEVGMTGTVERSTFVDWPGRGFEQVSVKWDNGRSLMPCVPPDRLTIIQEATT